MSRRLHAPWGVILAGGEGTRMQPLIQRWLGHQRPKQYCTFVGSRSMLQHTVARLLPLVPAEQLLTVVGRGHTRFLEAMGGPPLPGRVIEQPSNLGTAAGILLPLAHIMARDPTGTVLILPSDHYIRPDDRFQHHLFFADILSQQYPDRLVLLAAPPDAPEPDYGWVVPGPRQRCWISHRSIPDPMQAARFREKPDPAEARRLLDSGALWNTMIVAVRASTLWRLASRHLPAMTDCFEYLLETVRCVQQGSMSAGNVDEATTEVFSAIEPADFSRDLLQKVHASTLVLALDEVEWSDWGRPERVLQTLARVGRRPVFPAEEPLAREQLADTAVSC